MTRSRAFEVLRLDSNATTEEIKTAYAELSKKYHPEENPKEFQEIHEAYVTLTRVRNRRFRFEKVNYEEIQITEENVESEMETVSFDFSYVDDVKNEEQERHIQIAIKQLYEVLHRDKTMDTDALKRILSSTEREILYSQAFIEAFINLLNEGMVNKKIAKIVGGYLRPWDRTLFEQRKRLDRLNSVLEERKEYYYSEKKKNSNSISRFFLIVIVGSMFAFSLMLIYIFLSRFIEYLFVNGIN